jgi:hypothetical protein
MDKNGNILAKVLTTIGIVADWIVAGILKSQDGSTFFDLDNNLVGVRYGDYRVCLRGSNGALLIQHWNSSTGTWDEIGSFFGYTNTLPLRDKYLSQVNADNFCLGPFSKDVASIYHDRSGNTYFSANKDLYISSDMDSEDQAALLLYSGNAEIYGEQSVALKTMSEEGWINVKDDEIEFGTNGERCGSIDADFSGNTHFSVQKDLTISSISGGTRIDGANRVLLQTMSGKCWVNVKDDEIEFGINGERCGSIDATGFHGQINGHVGINTDISDQNGNVWHFRDGILTGVN